MAEHLFVSSYAVKLIFPKKKLFWFCMFWLKNLHLCLEKKLYYIQTVEVADEALS